MNWWQILGLGGITAIILGLVYAYMKAVECLWEWFNRDL
jgi:hypothetical protein